MSQENGEKQYKPSPKKLEQLRKQGVFLRARELYMGITLIAGLITLYAMSVLLHSVWVKDFTLVFNSELYLNDEALSKALLVSLVVNNLGVLLPFFIVVIGIFLVSVALFGGLRFSEHIVQFKGEKLNPLSNLKRIYSM